MSNFLEGLVLRLRNLEVDECNKHQHHRQEEQEGKVAQASLDYDKEIKRYTYVLGVHYAGHLNLKHK